MNVLVFNPGSNSLKAGIVSCDSAHQSASAQTKLVEIIVEGIGKEPRLSVYRGKAIAHFEPIAAQDFEDAASSVLAWLDSRPKAAEPQWNLQDVTCVGIRVVHGGPDFPKPALVTAEVENAIREFAKWAPLHNRRSLEILPPLRRQLHDVPLYAVFDTSFHATIPPEARYYPIPYELSQKHGIRRYGFHGISHRYLMERYAAIVHEPPGKLTLVTMHLESGCSITAIAKGRSVDNTMGLTPLEGLMMGTRSGDVDPSLVAFLAREEHLDVADVMDILEKKSGLLGVSGKSLDTRILMRDYDTNERVHLAMEMFSYRVLKAVGAYLAALGGAHAVIFGGGIAENTSLVRQRVCDGLRWCGLEMDADQNTTLIDREGRLSTAQSPVQAYVIPTEETLQIAHECCQAIEPRNPPDTKRDVLSRAI
jgi:acetate kinase